jgi:hypothetical protein
LVFYIAFVKCDGDEGDKLCGKYRCRTGNVAMLCRYCLCPTEKSSDVNHQPRFKTEPMIKSLLDKKDEQKLQRMSQHCCKNAFHGLRFGLHNNRGIHGATPLDMLHAILLGIFQTVRDVFFVQVGKDSKNAEYIDALAMQFGKLLQHQSDRDMPKTKLSKGIIGGKITAKEYSGLMLLIALVLQSTQGRSILHSCHKGNFKEKWLMKDWVLLVDSILTWEAFLKQEQIPKKLVPRLDKKNRFIMYLIKKVSAKIEGMGWNTQKFHQILHIAMDIKFHGVPTIVDTGPNEGHHKVSKKASRITQKNLAEFENQIAQRLKEMELLDLAAQEMLGLLIWKYLDPFDRLDDDSVEDMQEEGQEGIVPGQMAGEAQANAHGITGQVSAESLEIPQEAVTTGAIIEVFYNQNLWKIDWRFAKSPQKSKKEPHGMLICFSCCLIFRNKSKNGSLPLLLGRSTSAVTIPSVVPPCFAGAIDTGMIGLNLIMAHHTGKRRLRSGALLI